MTPDEEQDQVRIFARKIGIVMSALLMLSALTLMISTYMAHGNIDASAAMLILGGCSGGLAYAALRSQ